MGSTRPTGEAQRLAECQAAFGRNQRPFQSATSNFARQQCNREAVGVSVAVKATAGGIDSRESDQAVRPLNGSAAGLGADIASPLSDDEDVRGLANNVEANESDDETPTRKAQTESHRPGKRLVVDRGKRGKTMIAIPELTAEDEKRGEGTPGYFHDMLTNANVLLPTNLENLRHNSYALNLIVTRLTSWRMVLYVFRDLRHCSDNISVATSLHRLAKLSYRSKARLAEIQRTDGYSLLMKVVRKRFPAMKSRAKANVFWSLATLRESGMNGILDYCIRTVEEQGVDSTWKDQELANTAWALSSMMKRPLKLLTAMAELVAADNTATYHPQGVANLAWSFASLEFGTRKGEESLKPLRNDMYESLAKGSWARLSQFDEQAISNMIWSFGSAAYEHKVLCQAVNEEATKRLHNFSEHELSNTLIGLSRLGRVESTLIEALEREFQDAGEERFAGMKNQVLANVLWCLATTRHYSFVILERFAAEVTKRMQQLDYREVSVIMWAYAKLGFHPGEALLVEFNEYALRNLQSMTAQSASNILWALAVLQAPYLSCYQVMIDHLGTMDIGDVDVVQLHQLFQALLLAAIESRYNKDRPSLQVPEDVIELTTRVWKRLQNEFTVSEFQRDVSDRLDEMGIEHIEEYVAEEGLFRIDIAFSGPEGMRVAMEVDGPYHFTRNTNQPLGNTLLRHRLLRALGWSVVSIPSHEYFHLVSKLQKYEYIAGKLLAVNIQIDPQRIRQAAGSGRAKEDESASSAAENPDLQGGGGTSSALSGEGFGTVGAGRAGDGSNGGLSADLRESSSAELLVEQSVRRPLPRLPQRRPLAPSQRQSRNPISPESADVRLKAPPQRSSTRLYGSAKLGGRPPGQFRTGTQVRRAPPRKFEPNKETREPSDAPSESKP